MTVEIFVCCGWSFSNQFDIVSETHFSRDTIGRELWLAILKVAGYSFQYFSRLSFMGHYIQDFEFYGSL